jgi:hypothetical protein
VEDREDWEQLNDIDNDPYGNNCPAGANPFDEFERNNIVMREYLKKVYKRLQREELTDFNTSLAID